MAGVHAGGALVVLSTKRRFRWLASRQSESNVIVVVRDDMTIRVTAAQ
jgi:hypothetical protein